MFRSIDLKWMLKKFYLRWSSFVINISGNCKLSRWIEGCGGNLQFPPPRPGQPICFWNFILGRGSKKCEIYHCCHVGGLVGWPFRIIPGLPKHVIHMVWIVWCSSQASQMTMKVIIFFAVSGWSSLKMSNNPKRYCIMIFWLGPSVKYVSYK